jgi:hypothetical protein
MRGAVTPLSQYAFTAWCSDEKTQGQLYLYVWGKKHPWTGIQVSRRTFKIDMTIHGKFASEWYKNCHFRIKACEETWKHNNKLKSSAYRL